VSDPENSGAASVAEKLQAELAGLEVAKAAAAVRGNKDQLKAIDASIARREQLLAQQPAEAAVEQAVAPEPDAEKAEVKKPAKSRKGG
jgi:hypothetical protein